MCLVLSMPVTFFAAHSILCRWGVQLKIRPIFNVFINISSGFSLKTLDLYFYLYFYLYKLEDDMGNDHKKKQSGSLLVRNSQSVITQVIPLH